jgi:hypothetical protein
MAKSVKKTEKKITETQPCITCGKQFANDFFSVVERKKLEYEKFKIEYYVFKNKDNDWAIAEKVSFDILKEKENITEYFHIREFEPK